MPDDKTIRQPQDADEIDINDPKEVNNWCKSLNCTEEELKACVKKVGHMADDVKKCLGK